MNTKKDTTLARSTIGGLVGIGRRSGGIRIGVRGSVDSIHRNQCRLLIIARNASPRTTKILRRAAGDIPIILVESEVILGSWLGMHNVAAVSVVNNNLASGILKKHRSLHNDETTHPTNT